MTEGGHPKVVSPAASTWSGSFEWSSGQAGPGDVSGHLVTHESAGLHAAARGDACDVSSTMRATSCLGQMSSGNKQEVVFATTSMIDAGIYGLKRTAGGGVDCTGVSAQRKASLLGIPPHKPLSRMYPPPFRSRKVNLLVQGPL